MKLKKITLSGFKSFVDPTTIQLQSNLTGIVGPNGCGKSNIIDAIRWVMGEISAKQLRGSSMSDVIFNGASTRKPVGKASVELVFDNSDAGLGGEYAKYNEISIRREVSRDGGSNYFLNNASCRRKDITNVFLGTGLGPNSYAIIEQGTISKLIEAKPEEMRVVIEEAAGISKYKERRRETENRIKHTKENLFRLNDILEELHKQLKHLKSQANAAERYKKLKQEERLSKAQLHALHFIEIEKKLNQQGEEISNDETLLENKVTELHSLAANIAQLREKHNVDVEKFNEVQERYYRVGATIGRLEQQIQHTKERREQLANDLEQITETYRETTQQQANDKEQINLLLADQKGIETTISEGESVVLEAQQKLDDSEKRMKLFQDAWDKFNAESSHVLQELEVEQTKIKHLEHRVEKETQSIEKFKSELSGLDFIALNTEAEKLNTAFANLKNDRDKLHNDVGNKQEEISKQREEINKGAVELDRGRNKLQSLNGRRASLEVLQQAALGKNDAILTDWLKEHDLEEKARLVEKLIVEKGWENALETVLGVYLEAICVDGIINFTDSFTKLTHGSLTLFDQSLRAKDSNSDLQAITLASKVNSDVSIGNLLQGVYIAEDLSEALEKQSKLRPNESIITKDGVWVGPGWLRVAHDTNEKIGVLEREREMQDIDELIKKQKESCLAQEQDVEAKRDILKNLEQEYKQLQQQLHILNAEYSDVQSQATAKQTYLQHLKERAEVLKEEIKTHENNLRSESESLSLVFEKRKRLNEQKIKNDSRRQELMGDRESVEQELIKSRDYAQKTRQEASDHKMKLQLIQNQISYLEQGLERAGKRLEALKEQKDSIRNSIVETEAPITSIEQELQVELKKRLSAEADLTLAKQEISTVEQTLREMEQKHVNLQEANEKIRLVLEKLRTERQGLEVRGVTYREQISELDLQMDGIIADLPDGAVVSDWEEKISRLSAKIERLGLINLAAIEEYEQLQERKAYLESQNQDLVDALNTLEQAIRKIDQDTKDLFRDAYNQINEKFQELFPRIFNGGKATLQQTDNNLLDTGVVIMAQPPGKRNSSINLLSGGEKALTAIALVFSIFHLNPAPFCMLDEVDAPLDDANVLRFCNLVSEMSDAIQFIFVTHNKLTMEISKQLLGVTMQEAGVSRMVAVDIDTAVSLAGADK